MAIDQSYIIKAIDQYSPVLRKLNRELSEFNNKTATTSNKITSLGTKMSKLGRGMSLKVGAPLAAAGALALKTSFDFDKSMNMVRAVTGATGKQFDQLRNQALYLGQTTQFTARQAASAMQFFGMSGANVTEILGEMPSAMQLAASAQLDMGSATNIVTNVMHGFGLQLKELPHVNDLLVTAFTKTNVNLQQLGDGLKSLGPMARVAGVPLKDTIALLGELGQVGLGGAIGGRALKRALQMMLKPSAMGLLIMKKTNLQFTDSHGKMRKTIGILTKLQKLQKKGVLKPAAFTALFGMFGGPAMAAVIEQGAGAFKNLTDTMDKNDGISKKIAKTQMEGLPGALLRLKAALEHVQIKFTDANNSLVLFSTNLLTKFVLSLSNMNPYLKQFIGYLGGAAIAGGPLLMFLGKALGMLVLFGRIKFITALMSGGIVIAVLALGAAFFYLYQHSEQFRNSVKDVGTEINKWIIEPLKWVLKLTNEIADKWGKAVIKHPFDKAKPDIFGIDPHKLFSKPSRSGTLATPPNSFPTGGVAHLAFVPGVSQSAREQSVKSSLHIKVQDDNKVIKSITGESDADDFGMDTGLNMFAAR